MPFLEKPAWYMHLRYRARRILWEIKRDHEEAEYYLLPNLVDHSRAAVDIGANYGAYAGKLSTLAARVYCFEPNSVMAAQLRKRLPAAVVIHEAAVSNHNGKAEFFTPETLGATRAGALATIEARNPVTAMEGARREQVDVVRLDDVIAEPVGFIKIDVEGHELAVLEGAERILREHRPVLLIEATPTNNPATPRDVMDFLALRGYEGVFLYKDVMTPVSAFRANVHQELLPDGRMGPNHVFNFIFLPATAP